MRHWSPALLILALAGPSLIAAKPQSTEEEIDPLIKPAALKPCVAAPADSDDDIEPLIPIIFGISSVDRRFTGKEPCAALPVLNISDNPLPLIVPSMTTASPLNPDVTTQSAEQIRKDWKELFKTVQPTLQTNAPGGTTVPSTTSRDKEVSNSSRTTVAPPASQPPGVPVDDGAKSCQCVPYYLCRNNTVVKDGERIIEVRLFPGFGGENALDKNGQKPPCPNYLDVCCEERELLDRADPITPPPVLRKGCGQRNANGLGLRIVGNKDNEAQFGEFPWMVAVLKEQKFGNVISNLSVYVCGGALIHWKVVLTAAHCIHGKQVSELTIRAGEWDTQTRNELYRHQDRRVERIIVHEKFHELVLYNDFALLILKTPVEMAPNVDVVCLPQPAADFEGSRCFTSGWGKDIFEKEERYQVILKKVDVPWVEHDACEESLRETRLGRFFELDKSFVCAGGEIGKDACKGDGGGPLVCPLKEDPTRYVQAGIVAWGIGCGNAWPGVYANVASARLWIDKQMADNNLDSSVYQF